MRRKRSPGGRLARMLVGRLPTGDRVWGEALLAEAESLSGLDRFWWLFGLVALAIARVWSHSRSKTRLGTSRRGLSFGMLLGAILGLGIIATNVGPLRGPPTSDSGIGSAAGFLAIAAVLLLTGFANRRHLPSPGACAVATAITGLLAFLIAIVTFLVIDNLFLSTVAQQPDKIYGLAHSHFHSMRSYINANLLRGAAVMIPLTLVGASTLGALGAALHTARHRQRGQ